MPNLLLPLGARIDSASAGAASASASASAAAVSAFLLIVALLSPPIGGVGIDCFKCVSVNGSNPACEDPFHNNYTYDILERPCMAGRKNRDGLFPASSCIKVGGTFADGSGSIMVRGCALDSGTLTTDTEIIRMSHCGSFYFDGKYVHGCVQSCDDVDACNSAERRGRGVSWGIALALSASISRL